MTNKYKGTCHDCKKTVASHDGVLERMGRKWVVWCQSCYDRSDNSSYEDRACGDRAYEDACARACGFDNDRY